MFYYDRVDMIILGTLYERKICIIRSIIWLRRVQLIYKDLINFIHMQYLYKLNDT